MLTSLALAFVAGLVTILNPCVLPLVPIIIATAIGKSKWGPLALASGLVLSFSIFGLLVLAFGFSVGIDERLLRVVAGGLLVLAGGVMLVPQAQAALTTATAPLTGAGQRMLGRVEGEGAAGQFVVGGLLGLVWAPCVGPTLGIAIAAASQGENLLSAFGIFLIFGLGVATSILAFAYGSRKALGQRRQTLQALARYAKPMFAIAVLLVGVMVLTGFDRMIEIWVLDAMPQSLVEFTTRF
ncbi:MAG: cytochrome c biogenesis CcdA family protein [Pseudomonadota bacterium]